MGNLNDLRAEIDSIDERIVDLLNARAEAAMQIGKIKALSGVGVFAPDREREVLDRVTRLSRGPLSRMSLQAVYREMMSASFSLERPPRVGYLGPQGSYTHEAAMGKFGASVGYEPILDIRSVFEEIARGHIDYGLVPVENSLIGAVLDTLDAFIEHDVKICSEVHRAIHHHLLANGPLEDIEVVYSKPEAFMQCQKWLATTGLSARLCPAPSTSRAAQMAVGQAKAAAIGGALAGRLYGLNILAANIEDRPDNATRFFVLGKEMAKPTGCDRTSLTFTTAHQAGALVEVLMAFRKSGLNMTMITSRPSLRADQEYHFFVDLDGHAEDAAVRSSLEEARGHCKTIRVLGSYPRSQEVVS